MDGVMDDKALLKEMEALAGRFGMAVRYEPLKIKGSVHSGGYCRVRGQDFVIIDKMAATQDKIQVLVDALKRHDLDHIYILPSLRKILEAEGDQPNPRDRLP
jgi:hypothetical protein